MLVEAEAVADLGRNLGVKRRRGGRGSDGGRAEDSGREVQAADALVVPKDVTVL